jgi:capsular polysaccharide biosynthesis protein
MNNKKITIKDIIVRWQFITIVTLAFMFVAFIVSAILPTKYQSDISVIVIQEQASEKVDAFGATKSAEFLSNIFTRVIYTTTFFNSVQEAPFEVRHNFSRDPQEREKEWKKIVNVKKVNNTGIIRISVVDKSRKTAQETAKAIAYTLTTNSKDYHGGGKRVKIKLIDGPNTPLQPTIPHILPNTFVGGILGFVLAIVFIYFFPNKINFGIKSREITQDLIESVNEQESEMDKNVKREIVDTEETVVTNHFNNDLQGTIEFEDESMDGQMDEMENNTKKTVKKYKKQENQEANTDIEQLHRKIAQFHRNKK